MAATQSLDPSQVDSNGVNEYDAITSVIQQYIDGARSGRGDDMKPAFHEDATIFGHVGADLFAGPIQQLFAWTTRTVRRRGSKRGSSRSTSSTRSPA